MKELFLKRTRNGKLINLQKPDPNDVLIEDIAWSLSKQQRFDGHGSDDYNVSVALHCVICSYIVQQGQELLALMHDAHEAYLGDISSPVKNLIGRQRMLDIQKPIDLVIFNRFNVKWKTGLSWVQVADLSHLKWEYEHIFDNPEKLKMFENIPTMDVPAYLVNAYKQDNISHYNLFLNRFKELTE